MSDRLKGKRAFVTAGAAGIGRACGASPLRARAPRYLQPTSTKKASALLAKEGVSEVARLDVRDTAAVAAMAKRVGKVDILLNAAGFVHHGTVLGMLRRGLGFLVRPQRQVDAPHHPGVSAGHAAKPATARS